MKEDNVLNEKMFELRKQGISYQKIREALLQQYGKTFDLKTIILRCKKMFKANGIEEPICNKGRKEEWNQGEQAKKINDEIFKLKEQGYSYARIMEILEEKGIKISKDKVARLCRNIYAQKGKNIPKVGEASPMDREELYNLAEKGLSNNDIWEMLKQQGMDITFSKIETVMKNIYQEKGKKRGEGRKKTKDVFDEEIYNLKMQGKSFREISEYYKSKGIDIGETSLYKKAKIIFESKGEEIPRAKNKPSKKQDIFETYKTKIFELRENKTSIREIMDRLQQEDGIKISRHCLEKNLKTIYKERGKEEPTAKVGRKRKQIDEPIETQKINDYDEELYNLREQGYGIKDIKDILEKKYEFIISTSTIYQRIKKIYEAKGKEMPRASKGQKIKEQVLELRQQGLKYNEIIDKMNSEYGIKVNRYTVLKICRKKYGKATRRQIVEMGRLQKLEDELNSLQQRKQESQQLLEQYKELRKMREEEQNVRE